MTGSIAKAPAKAYGKRVTRALLDYGSYIVGIVVIIVFSVMSDVYFTPQNLVGIVRDAAPLLCASIGMTFVVMSGKMDLSIASVLLCSASLGALLINKLNCNPYLAMLVVMLSGAVMGALNGFLISGLGLNAWLTTLSLKLGLRGLSLLLTQSAVLIMPQAITDLRDFKLFGLVPVYVIVALLLVAGAQLVLKYAPFGRNVLAVGTNEQAAAKLGISVKQVYFWVYVICGLFAGVGGAMMSINLGVIGPYSGQGYEFLGAMVIVLGGTSLAGGKGSILPGTLVGVLIVSCLENGLYIIGVNPYLFGVFRGAIIFYAMYIDSIKNKSL